MKLKQLPSFLLLLAYLVVAWGASYVDKPWPRAIKERIATNRNFVCLGHGGTGTGKSYACLAIALMLDPTFNASRIIFSAREFLHIMKTDAVGPGQAVCFEECGQAMDSADWQSTTNKALRHVFETCRSRRQIILMNTPSVGFLSKGVRVLLHAVFNVQSIDRLHGIAKLHIEGCQYNSKNDKQYFKRLRMRVDGKKVPINSWKVPKPPQWLIDQYEAKKQAFQTKLYEDLDDKLEGLETKSKGAPKSTMHCPKCAYEWQSSKKTVARCPRCYYNKCVACALPDGPDAKNALSGQHATQEECNSVEPLGGAVGGVVKGKDNNRTTDGES